MSWGAPARIFRLSAPLVVVETAHAPTTDDRGGAPRRRRREVLLDDVHLAGHGDRAVGGVAVRPGPHSLELRADGVEELVATPARPYTRSMPMQVCPALLIPPHTAASAALSMSASSATTIASLPPHSMSTGTRPSAQAAITLRPVRLEPVSAILPTPLRHSAAPVSPNPVTRDSTGASGTAS